MKRKYFPIEILTLKRVLLRSKTLRYQRIVESGWYCGKFLVYNREITHKK